MSGKEIKCIKCTRFEKVNGKNLYILVLTWSDLHSEYIGRTPNEFTEFRAAVNLKTLINDDSSKSSNLQMPEIQLKEKKMFGSKVDEKNKKAVDDFFQHFLRLPSNILKNSDVVNFFSHTSAATEDGVIELVKKGEKSSFKRPSPDTNVEIKPAKSDECQATDCYEEIPADAIRRPEIKNDIEVGNEEYAEVIVSSSSTTNSEKLPPVHVMASETVEDKSTSDPAEQDLYASIRKSGGKPLVIKPIEDEYADTSVVSSSMGSDKPGEDLYAEIGEKDVSDKPTITSKPQKPPPISKTKPNSFEEKSDMKKSPGPLTPIPPMPQFSPPTLEIIDSCDTVSTDSEPGDIQIMAIADYKSSMDNVLSFSKGSLATLIVQSESNWWCIKMGSTNGWVPADYWKMLNDGDCAVLKTNPGAPWFVGKLSRAECELSLMEHGKEQDFVVRESDKGHYALSVKHDKQIHHFPIQLTEAKKYNIGKHDFKTVYNVISYYKKNALFYDDKNRSVSLGSPLVILKQ